MTLLILIPIIDHHQCSISLLLSNSAACSSAVRKPAISLADSTDLRVLLNIMYLMVETIRQDDPADMAEWRVIRETFRAELGGFLKKQYPAMTCYKIDTPAITFGTSVE